MPVICCGEAMHELAGVTDAAEKACSCIYSGQTACSCCCSRRNKNIQCLKSISLRDYIKYKSGVFTESS